MSTSPSADAVIASESLIVKVMAELLDAQNFSPQDDFFDAGGHSRTVVQLVARVEEITGRRLSVRDVFDAPTAAELAHRLAATTQ